MSGTFGNVISMADEQFGNAASFYTKMNAIRNKVKELDMETDKFISLGGTKGYRYVSIYKMKNQIGPLFAEAGIEPMPSYRDLTVLHAGGNDVWSITLDMKLTDIDTGYTTMATTIGTCIAGSTERDKGATIAMSFAFKQWLSDTYFLNDGTDPDGGDTDTSNGGGTFKKQTSQEVEMAKVEIAANAVKPTVPATPAAKAVPIKDAVKPTVPAKPAAPVTPAAKPNIRPMESAEEVPAKAVKDEVKPAAPATPAAEKEGITQPLMNTIENIINVRTQWAKEGKLTPEEYNKMSSDYCEVTDSFTAMAFIKKYKVAQ